MHEIEDSLLNELKANGFITTPTNVDSKEKIDAKLKLEELGLVYRKAKSTFRLTKDGHKAIELGSLAKWMEYDEAKNKTTINHIETNNGIANQDSFRNLSDSPITQSVKHTPSKKEAKQTWYTSPMFTFIIWPLLVMIVGGFILFKLGWI